MRVHLSRRAERDLLTIHEWIRVRSPIGAERWLSAFEAAILRLSQSATECQCANESERVSVELQQQSFKTRRGLPYRLVFTIHKDIVEIVAIRGSGQDWLRPDEIDIAE